MWLGGGFDLAGFLKCFQNSLTSEDSVYIEGVVFVCLLVCCGDGMLVLYIN